MEQGTKQKLLSWIERCGGILKLRPEYVRRFYPDLHRINQPRGTGFIPERWIGSSTSAVSPGQSGSGGLSLIDGAGVFLREAIVACPEEMIGPKLLKAHGPELRLLVKILDPAEPIVFHLHATDAQVKRLPKNFMGHRFGKDEAYYFLDAPKGPAPYTHVGLYPGVTRRELADAVRKGRDYALELSPAIYQEYVQGLFVPAGVPHRPGTALTLEIQQPSDVYTLLETHAAGKRMPPAQVHPGFKSLEDAFKLIDIKAAVAAGSFQHNRLAPQTFPRKGGEVATIFPAEICRKFAGDRLRITGSMRYSADSPLVLFVWRGRGTINGKPLRAGEEFLTTYGTARQGLEFQQTGGKLLEIFAFHPAGVA